MKKKPSKQVRALNSFKDGLSKSEQKRYAIAIRQNLKMLGNAANGNGNYGQNNFTTGSEWATKNAAPSLSMVGDTFGIFTGKKTLGGNTGYSGAFTPIQIPPSPPFSPQQWMSAAAMAAWQKFPERAASVGLMPSPYPTATSQISGQVPPSEPTHDESVVSAQRVLQYLLQKFNPIRGLTPERLGQYLEQWDLGFIRYLALAWNQIKERDDQIKGVMSKRSFAVSRLHWEIITDDDSPESQAHKNALEEAYAGLTCTSAIEQNQQGGVNLLIRQAMNCIGDKYTVHEIVWKPDVNAEGGDTLTAHFRMIPLHFFENRTGTLRYLPYELALDGIPLDQFGWCIFVGDGLNFATSIAYIYKQLGIKTWANFNDKYGMPFIHAKTTAAYGSPEWNQMVAAVEGIRSDGSLVTNVEATVEALKLTVNGELPQKEFCDRMDRAIARLWRGGDLSTMSRGGSGASGALPQLEVADEIAEADSVLLSESLNFYFDRAVIRYRFGANRPKARFKIIPPKDIDTAKEIAVDQFLLSVGVPMSVSDLQERYGRPNPDPDDTLAVPPMQAAQIGKGVGDESANGPLSLGNGMYSPSPRLAEEFRKEATKRLTLQQAKMLGPLADRMKRAALIRNDEQRQAELANIRKDLPTLFKSVNENSVPLIQALEDIIGTALVSGAVESAAQ